MIHFSKIRWKNFLSTGDTFTEISLDQSPSTLVIGENGSGKSTMLDALTFGLFSKPFRKINKPQLVNSVNERGMLVEVEFKSGSKNYLVRRGVKPNIFEIHIDGELMDQDSTTKLYQDRLEKYILKLNYKSFTQIIVLGSSSFQPFMQLSTYNRREVIEDLLDIGVFSTMNTLLKEQIAENSIQLSHAKQNYSIIEERIDMQKKYIEEVKQISDNKIENTEGEISTSKIQISDLNEQIEVLDHQRQELLDAIEPLSGVSDKLSKMQLFDGQIQNNLRKVNQEVAFFNDNEDCPVCGQVLDYRHVQEILKVKYDKIRGIEEGYTKLQSEITSTKSEVTRLEKFASGVRGHDDKIKECASSIKVIQRYMDKLLKEVDYLGKVKDKSEGDEERLSHLLTERYRLGGAIQEFKDHGLYLMSAGDMLKDTGIKTKIIKQYLPVMNNLVNKYLTAMDSYFNFTIDENFSEIIKSRFRDEFSYDSFSEGEKMRIDLALLFTWRAVAKLKNSASTNLLILDEVFDSSLDVNGTDEFLKLLQSLGLKSNVFVISHKGDTLYEKFDSVIKFEKVQNFSKVV
tara:strand:- start:2331 stop:4043 length:1713 start_codon:yes stop_codon:yes gene_type:complete